jgi:uncharacterized protein YqcC (DUF446 family)
MDKEIIPNFDFHCAQSIEFNSDQADVNKNPENIEAKQKVENRKVFTDEEHSYLNLIIDHIELSIYESSDFTYIKPISWLIHLPELKKMYPNKELKLEDLIIFFINDIVINNNRTSYELQLLLNPFIGNTMAYDREWIHNILVPRLKELKKSYETKGKFAINRKYNSRIIRMTIQEELQIVLNKIMVHLTIGIPFIHTPHAIGHIRSCTYDFIQQEGKFINKIDFKDLSSTFSESFIKENLQI